ncbi:MAG: hypothetical protein LBR22_00265 [Desulfovibrio sp.]|jgi:hypothetical protein|nr:hypothetical protein [Desulfovibrio sp.]
MKKFNMRKGRQGRQYCTIRESTAKGREGPDRDHWYVGTPDALVSKLERAAHLEQVVSELEARAAQAKELVAKEKERAAGLRDAMRILAEAVVKLSVDEPAMLDPEVVRMAERFLMAPAVAPAREDETSAWEVPPAIPDGDDSMGNVASDGTVPAAMAQDSPSGNSQVEAPVARDATSGS